MNNNTKQYYKQLHTHPNNIPHAPQTEHIKNKKIINKKHKHTTTKNGTTYTTHLPLIQLTRGHCPECQCPTYSYDQWKGEKVCPQCGLVLEDNLTTYTPPLTHKNTHKPTYTYQEKKYLKKHGHHHYTGNKKEWTKNTNHKLIQTLTNQLQLNKTQKQQTHHIINTIGFKKLHARANKTTITLGVIRYIMKQTYTTTTHLRYNQGLFKNNLTPETYNIIEKNIIKHNENKLDENRTRNNKKTKTKNKK